MLWLGLGLGSLPSDPCASNCLVAFDVPCYVMMHLVLSTAWLMVNLTAQNWCVGCEVFIS